MTEPDTHQPTAAPQLVLVEMAFTEEGAAAIESLLPRMESELRSLPGLLTTRVFKQEGGRYLFYTVWQDRASVQAWVDNAFHREVLMANFRAWAIEATFTYWTLTEDHPRVRKCPACKRWTSASPGWEMAEPATCSRCGAPLRRDEEQRSRGTVEIPPT